MTDGDRYRKMIGELALERGLVDAGQLYQALTHQARSRDEGKGNKLLGQVLVELGFMTADQLQDLVEELYPPDQNPEEEKGVPEEQ